MAYEKTIWKNREVERPRTFMMQNNPDGTVTLIPAEGEIIEPGTPIIAENMNKIEQGIKDAHDELAAHKAEIATETKLGHVMVDGDTIQITSTGVISSKSGFDASTEYIEIGLGATSTKGRNIAIGYNAISGVNSAFTRTIAIGQEAFANGTLAFAVGYRANAEENRSHAIGMYSESLNSNEGCLGSTNQYNRLDWIVPHSFTVNGTKNFEIPHPKPEKKATHRIRHGAVESPTPGDTLYRWKIQATKNNDIVTIDLPDYFIWLNKDVQIFVTPQGHFGNGYGVLNRETEQLEIHCQFEGEYNVLVIGTRNDDHQSVQDWYIKGVEREIGESWTGETYAFSVDEIIEVEEIKEVSA